MARFVITTDRRPNAWQVRVTRERRDGALVAEAPMRLLEDLARGMLPAPRDLAALERLSDKPGASAFEVVWELYARLLKRQAGTDNLVEAFGTYLHGCLLADVWAAIEAAAAGESIELALCWPAEESDLIRLPWEMMRFEDRFLAANRRYSVTRIVQDADAEVGELPLLPRVLFVVGAALDDPDIKVGAEYVGLLRQLQTADLDLALNTRVLLDASVASLRAAIADFRPSVLHLICHGGLERGQPPYLELQSDDRDADPQRVRAPVLFGALNDPGPQPPVVVLNACHSSRPPDDRVAAPFAAALVQLGVPVAVGMWGRVSDQACRLFTRRLYEAMLKAESSIAWAVAEGRRAGYLESVRDPGRAGDWAFPTIFLSEAVSDRAALDEGTLQQARELRTIQRRYAPTSAFCDRFEALETEYPKLVPSTDERRWRVLALREVRELAGKRLGKTRLIRELARRAVADGHVACVAGLESEPPVTALDLMAMIGAAVQETRERFGLRDADCYQTAMLRLAASGDGAARAALDKSVTKPFQFSDWPAPQQLSLGVIATAIRLDLLALAEAVRTDPGHLLRRAASGAPADLRTRVIVLVDQVHLFGAPALQLLTQELLGVDGAGRPYDPVPVIVAYSAPLEQAREDAPAAASLKEFFETSPPDHVLRVELGPFAPPDMDPLPYEQYLLGRRPPIIVRHEIADARHVDVFYAQLWKAMSGIPSQLGNDDVEDAIRLFSDLLVVRAADDDEVLTRARRPDGV